MTGGLFVRFDLLRLFPAVALAALIATVPHTLTAQTPDVGAKAPNFTLATPEGKKVSLDGLRKQGPVVLIVLRGFPGYQCPYCTRQVHDFETNASQFEAKGVQLMLVYPGPADDLTAHAQDFLKHEDSLPANFHLVIDPDYTVTNLYGLRWDAQAETAYPSTFVLNRKGVVTYRKISHQHADRTTAAEVLAELDKAL
ncbi:MAG TPA: peroxiredoxin family protein [Terracidiphilus sp.]|nr:peroxiredoxin family protein [Terracidiphilus sp.]